MEVRLALTFVLEPAISVLAQAYFTSAGRLQGLVGRQGTLWLGGAAESRRSQSGR